MGKKKAATKTEPDPPPPEDLIHECEHCGETFDDFDEAVKHEDGCDGTPCYGTLEDEAEAEAEDLAAQAEEDAEDLAALQAAKGAEGALVSSLSCDMPEDLIALSKLREGEVEEAHEILQDVGYEYRYSNAAILAGLGEGTTAKSKKKEKKEKKAVKKCDHAQIVDEALPAGQLGLMKEVFCSWDEEEDYWVANKYNEASRFISWSHKLEGPPKNGVEQVLWRIKALAERQFPDRMKDVGAVEWWAHSRPPKSGHWMHFDSANDNKGGRATPVMSSVLFLSEGPFPPTLVTDELHTSNDTTSEMSPDTNAWMVHPKENRLLLFDGTAMHSVIPGDPHPGPGAGRRVTFMCVFWPKGVFCAQQSDGTERRPLPKSVAWAQALGKKVSKRKRGDEEEALPEGGPVPQFIGKLWVPVASDQGKKKKAKSVPYPKFFQGIANWRE